MIQSWSRGNKNYIFSEIWEKTIISIRFKFMCFIASIFKSHLSIERLSVEPF